jgi:NADPH-dependent glutamate synthase beta subunit-like oxidoreductase
MKLDKSIVQRRIDLMAEEGVVRVGHSVFMRRTNFSYEGICAECTCWGRYRRP